MRWRNVSLPCRRAVQVGDRAEGPSHCGHVKIRKWVWHLSVEIGGKLQGSGKAVQKKTTAIKETGQENGGTSSEPFFCFLFFLPKTSPKTLKN